MTTPEGGEEAAVPAVAATVSSHGTVTPFDAKLEQWSEYAERLELYFIANDIVAPAKRRAILLHAVGPATYKLLKTLASPTPVTALTFEELVEKAKLHFNPKPSPIVRRYEFNTRTQREGEAVSTFVAELRNIAQDCEYGEVLSDMLRDRVVCGICDKAVQRSLLREPNLSFDKALEIALAAEAAEKDSRRLTDYATAPVQDKDTSAVNKVTQPKSTRPTRLNKDRECHRCGGKHHPAQCNFKGYDCHYCKKKGHLAKMCWKKAKEAKDKDEPEHAHVVNETPTEEKGEYGMFNMNTGSSKPFQAVVKVNGTPITMEIDTGASASIVSEETFTSLQSGQSKLKLDQASVRLLTYTGESITVVGSTQVTVEYKGQTRTLPLLVTQGNGPSLLGRDWLGTLRLDWQRIFKVESPRTLQGVLEENSDVFKPGLGKLNGVTAKLYVDSSVQPRFHKPRPLPFALRSKVDEELDRLQGLGVILPVQFADWAAPIIPVQKGDGKMRLCGDYKVTINTAIKQDKYPIPRIEELFASLAGGKSFSKLDLSHAYLQVPLDTQSQKYVTIATHKGLFQYTRLPFGVSSAPSCFQRVMENLLQGISGTCVYLDDILVTGETEQQHLENLAQVLNRLRTAGMRLKREKCAFLLPSVTYLGHVISAQGLHTEDSKVKAVVDAPAPRDVAELRSFLGMVNYYSKFLPDLATVLSPLYMLLQHSTEWKWGQKQREAFKQAKTLLQSNRVLMHFDDRLPLVLSCDASPYGLGAILAHRMPDGSERPVGFASRTLAKAERNYSQLDKEALAIIFAVKRYHQYLYGRHFEIKTDHKPLTHIFGESRGVPVMASGRLQRWALTLGAYDYSIQYREGSKNANADALSRLPLPSTVKDVPRPAELVHLMEHLDTSLISSSLIRTWTDQDQTLSKVKSWLLNGWPSHKLEEQFQPFVRRKNELSVEGGCVLWGNRVVVPRKGWDRVLEVLHEAHPGIVRMKSFARGFVWWPGLDEQIENCVKECGVCQQSRKIVPVVPLHPWVWPVKPWSRIHIDYAGPFEGKMFLLTIDAHSKWLEVHVTNSATSSTTIELLRKSFACLGLPDVVVSDNAATFTSDEFTDFLKKNGIKHVRTPPYHPASNGVIERAVQTFKEGMKRLTEGSMSTRVSRFLFKYRITPHSTTGVPPAELIFGRKIRSHLDHLRPNLGDTVQQSQTRQKTVHDSHAKTQDFAVGDPVYVLNYGQGPKWLVGKVMEVLGSVVYHVLLEDGRQVKRHAEQLRKRQGTMKIPVSLHTQPPGVVETELLDDSSSTNAQEAVREHETTPPPETMSCMNEPEQVPEGNTTTVPQETSRGPSNRDVRRSTRERRPPDRFGQGV